MNPHGAPLTTPTPEGRGDGFQTHPRAAPRPPPCPRSFCTTNIASLSVTTRLLSSSACAAVLCDLFVGKYGLAHELAADIPPPPPVAPPTGVVVVAGEPAAAGVAAFGFGGVGVTFATFIQAYFPVPNPAA
ncbi:hypothetical protein EW146_g8503 [Bondarzewia mesenterica]|uniref:Uncharacterized protein n=1 Tax=Bondarzewia mesenterica TaxID=1095465 RepID=A0A4S4LDV4_9AGAM|nr:hypothetical protein EW146_g8503 [Bondarzewia mesenterica]